MRELLRSVWDEPRPSRPPVRVWRDWALVAVLVPIAILEGLLRHGMPSPVISVVVAVGLIPTLLWRRTRPLPMVVIAFGTCALVPLVTGGEAAEQTMVFLLILVYALFRWGSGREALVGALVIVAKIGLSGVVGLIGPGDTFAGMVVVSTAAALGAALRYRSRYRTRELERVKLLERERLARDLHDTVAHHVSAMAIRAQAGLATLDVNPDAAADALRVIEAEASRALTEMRTIVRALRDEPAPARREHPPKDEPADLTPSPRIVDIERLATRSRPGPVVEVEIRGDLDDLSPSVGTAIYRLAQESVTNARRHARQATRIDVRVAADGTTVRLRVSDDGDTSHVRPGSSGGYGLVGMIERADLLGGTCQAGPDPGRGWTVTAELPRTGTA